MLSNNSKRERVITCIRDFVDAEIDSSRKGSTQTYIDKCACMLV